MADACKLHQSVTEYMQTDEARALAAQFSTVDELIDFIRHLDQRDDLGDPRDGPRRLVQTNHVGQDLPGHVAYVEIHSRNVGDDAQQFSADRAYALADRMARTNEHCLSLVANQTDRMTA